MVSIYFRFILFIVYKKYKHIAWITITHICLNETGHRHASA